jgi:hypothetical protein
LISDIPAGEVKISNLFYSAVSFLMKHLESLYEQLSNEYQSLLAGLDLLLRIQASIEK